MEKPRRIFSKHNIPVHIGHIRKEKSRFIPSIKQTLSNIGAKQPLQRCTAQHRRYNASGQG